MGNPAFFLIVCRFSAALYSNDFHCCESAEPQQSEQCVKVCYQFRITLYMCLCFHLGAALYFPLAGGECVWQSGRHHRWLEPATPALTEQ